MKSSIYSEFKYRAYNTKEYLFKYNMALQAVYFIYYKLRKKAKNYPKVFLLISIGVSRSALIQKIINAHPDLREYGESLSKNIKNYKAYTTFMQMWHAPKVWGFKVLPQQEYKFKNFKLRELIQYFGDLQGKFIYLEREK